MWGLRMLAAKNSRKRMPARSPAAAMSAGRRSVGSGRVTSFRVVDRVGSSMCVVSSASRLGRIGKHPTLFLPFDKGHYHI